MARPAKTSPMRRSTRVQARIPVTLSGTLPDGTQFNEDTYILTLSKFGARVKTRQPLRAGMRVRVQPKHRSETATPFRVVWVGREGSPRHGEIGVEYVEASNPFEVSFPE